MRVVCLAIFGGKKGGFFGQLLQNFFGGFFKGGFSFVVVTPKGKGKGDNKSGFSNNFYAPLKSYIYAVSIINKPIGKSKFTPLCCNNHCHITGQLYCISDAKTHRDVQSHQYPSPVISPPHSSFGNCFEISNGNAWGLKAKNIVSY